MNIQTYETLSAPWPDELDEKVQRAINEGWQPYGQQYFHSAFHQPMVKSGGAKEQKKYDIKGLKLTLRAINALKKAGLHPDSNIEALEGYPAKELLNIRGCGIETAKEILNALAEHGIEMDTKGFPNEYLGEV